MQAKQGERDGAGEVEAGGQGDLSVYSLDTVKVFREDAVRAGYTLWTRSRHEHLVERGVKETGLTVFLPSSAAVLGTVSVHLSALSVNER